MKRFFPAFCIIVICFLKASSANAQDTAPYFLVTNNLALSTNAVLYGALSEPPALGGGSTPTSPTNSIAFDALDDPNTVVPPDTQGAVGLSNVVTMLNSQIRIQDRTGNIISTTTLSNFWGSVGGFTETTDPRITYDPYNNRWIAVTITDFDVAYRATASLLIGVSKNANPAFTNWNKYRYRVDSNSKLFADYPVVGFNKDWIVVQANLITLTNTFYGSQISIFTKTNLYAGHTETPRVGNFTTIGFSQTPMITYDTNIAALYLVQDAFGQASNTVSHAVFGYLNIFQVTGSVGSESLSVISGTPTNTPWADAPNVNNFAPQKGISVGIMNDDSRIQNVVYRNGSIWCTHTIFLPNNSPTRSAVQWWQLGTNGAVENVKRIDDAAGIEFYAFPSIAVNRFGDALVGYSSFSTNQYASGNYSYRDFSEGDFELPAISKSGLGVYYRNASQNRWGDLSATVVDPLNDSDFWTVQEYAATPVNTGLGQGDGRWGTWWAKVPVVLPGNDYFTNAVVLSGSKGSTNGTNVRATQEAGEPNHAGNTKVKSVWYKWTAPTNGNVVFDTKGSALDTILAIYTGTTVSGLTLVTNDHNSVLGDASHVVLNATAGTVYRIAVDGFSGAQNPFDLNWNQPTTPVVTIQPNSQSIYQGSSVTFSAMAIGRPNPTFQWRLNNSAIIGATNASYTINPVGTNNAGNYTFVASNSSGSVTSVVAVLTVLTSQATMSGVSVTNNAFKFSISQVSGLNYIVQGNTNLGSTNWVAILTNTAPFTITDTAFTNNPHRFYRAVYKP